MKTIAMEIREWLAADEKNTQATLSKRSGVPRSTICNLLRGKRKNVIGPNQDALRKAMGFSNAEAQA